jgi:hypothetical protein
VLEAIQRRFLNDVVVREAAELADADALFYVSDVDEILDASMLLKSHLETLSCTSPSLHWYVYNVRCPIARRFSSGVLFRINSGWFNGTLARHPDLLLHKVSKTYPSCPQSRQNLGWHLSYFMSTPDMLTKLRSTSHAYEPGVAKVLRAKDPAKVANLIVSKCLGFFGARPRISPSDDVKRPPWLPMLTQNVGSSGDDVVTLAGAHGAGMRVGDSKGGLARDGRLPATASIYPGPA